MKNIWIKIDQIVQEIPQTSQDIRKIFSLVDDFTDLLLFIQDILTIYNLSTKIQEAIQMSLLNFAYLPVLVKSLTTDYAA